MNTDTAEIFRLFGLELRGTTVDGLTIVSDEQTMWAATTADMEQATARLLDRYGAATVADLPADDMAELYAEWCNAMTTGREIDSGQIAEAE